MCDSRADLMRSTKVAPEASTLQIVVARARNRQGVKAIRAQTIEARTPGASDPTGVGIIESICMVYFSSRVVGWETLTFE